MNIGDKFPDLLGTDGAGNPVKLSDYPGKRFIIYFYPKDNTPGCSMEAVSLRDANAEFADLGYQIIGVSRDTAASHCKFAEKYALPFPLVADTEHVLCETAGVWQPKKMAGRVGMGIVRTTFVTDSAGVVTDKVEKVQTKTAAEQLFQLLGHRNDINPS